MTTDLLERPAARAAAPTETTTPVEAPSTHGPSRWLTWVAAVVPLAGAAVLFVELRHVSFEDVWQHLRPGQVALAVGWIAVSIVAAAYNLTGFSAVRVRLRRSLQVQLAVSGLRVVTPSAVSTPLVGARFLVRQGATVADAAATVAVAQLVQLAATIGIVAVLSTGAHDVLPHPGGGSAAVPVVTAVVAALLLAVGLAVACSHRVRAGVAALGRSVRELAVQAKRHPGRTGGAVVASAALTLAHVLAFAACVAAVGGSASMLTLALVYLGAASAGSLLPTPGGIGAVEAALIAGLTAVGLALPVATAATVLSRLVAVWLPAVPGWWAMIRLRRDGLL